MKKCLECQIELPSSRTNFCSKLHASRFIQRKHQKKINEKSREKTRLATPEDRAKKAKWARDWRANNPDKSRALTRKAHNTGELATDDGVLFYGYKEPLTKFNGGFGYKGVLSYSKDRDKVQCHFCGRLFKFLNNGHLMKCHKLTAAEYKEKTELSPVASLVGEGTRMKLLERPYNPNHMIELKKAQEKRKNIIRKTGRDPNHHPKMRLEIKNKRGTCPDQLLDMIDKTVKSFGRVPTMEEFVKFHNGKYYGSIRETYGTWTNALAKLNLRTNFQSKRYSDEHILEQIKNFYEVNKRTPRWSDFERGLLPSVQIYYERFGNLNNARVLANVPLILQIGRKREEWMPTQKERTDILKNLTINYEASGNKNNRT